MNFLELLDKYVKVGNLINQLKNQLKQLPQQNNIPSSIASFSSLDETFQQPSSMTFIPATDPLPDRIIGFRRIICKTCVEPFVMPVHGFEEQCRIMSLNTAVMRKDLQIFKNFHTKKDSTTSIDNLQRKLLEGMRKTIVEWT